MVDMDLPREYDDEEKLIITRNYEALALSATVGIPGLQVNPRTKVRVHLHLHESVHGEQNCPDRTCYVTEQDGLHSENFEEV